MSATSAELRAFKKSVERAKEQFSREIPRWARLEDDSASPNELEEIFQDENSSDADGREGYGQGEDHDEFDTRDSTSPSRHLSYREMLALAKPASSHDPPIFALRVRRGSAEFVIHQILVRTLAYIQSSLSSHSSQSYNAAVEELGLYTAFTPNPRGVYIYVEAESKAHLLTHLRRIHDLFLYDIEMVGIHERKSLLLMCVREKELHPGDFARPTRGRYRGDLCQVIDVKGVHVTVRTIPRLNYNTSWGKVLHERKEGDEHSKSLKIRLPQRFFDPELVRGAIEQSSDGLWFWKGHYFDTKGFLLLIFPLNAVDHGGKMKPMTQNEFETFDKNQTSEEIAQESGGRINPFYSPIAVPCGELVKIVRGRLKGIQGRIIERTDTELTLKTDHDKIIRIDSIDVEPYFPISSSVVVTSGTYYGEAGTVLYLTSTGGAIIQSDDDPEYQFQVSVRDLEDTCRYIPATITYVADSWREGDLVAIQNMCNVENALDTQNHFERVVLILKCTSRYLTILGIDNTLGKCLSRNVIRKLTHLPRSFCDARNDIVHIGEDIKLRSQASRTTIFATVCHVYMDSVFLQSREHNINFGYFIEHRKSLVLATRRWKPEQEANEEESPSKKK